VDKSVSTMKRNSPADNSGAGKNHKLDFEGDGSRDVGSRQKTPRNEQESIHLLSRHSPRQPKIQQQRTIANRANRQ
jgi:hypothetical protein